MYNYLEYLFAMVGIYAILLELVTGRLHRGH